MNPDSPQKPLYRSSVRPCDPLEESLRQYDRMYSPSQKYSWASVRNCRPPREFFHPYVRPCNLSEGLFWSSVGMYSSLKRFFWSSVRMYNPSKKIFWVSVRILRPSEKNFWPSVRPRNPLEIPFLWSVMPLVPITDARDWMDGAVLMPPKVAGRVGATMAGCPQRHGGFPLFFNWQLTMCDFQFPMAYGSTSPQAIAVLRIPHGQFGL